MGMLNARPQVAGNTQNPASPFGRDLIFILQKDYMNRSLLLSDNQEQIVSHIEAKIKRARNVFIGFVVLSVALLALTIYLVVSPAASQDVLDQNKSLKQLNSQLRAKRDQLRQELSDKKDVNGRLLERQQLLQSQLQQNNGLIAYLEDDIKLNCNPSKQRLRFNMTDMNAFTLSVESSGSNDGTPAVTFLNVSGNKLVSFSDNSLPSLEYLGLTGNPIAKITNNRLDKTVQIVGVCSQPLLQQFSSNFIPLIRSLNLSHNNLFIFNDNVISAIQTLDLSDNNLTSFSNFTCGSLERLNISLNPITQFNLNTFQNLVELSSIFTSKDPILFNGSYFGKLDTLFLAYNDVYRPYLTFTNNYLPLLSNLTIYNFTVNYDSFKTNNIPVLAHLKFSYCFFSNRYKYPQLFRSIKSLEFFNSQFDKFTGLTYPNLTNLTFKNIQIKQFSNNSLPALRELVIKNQYYVGSFWGNSMPNLKKVIIYEFSINDSSFFASLPSLQYLQLAFLSNFSSFDNYVFPQLTTLYLLNNKIQSFSNNTLPALTNLTISDLCHVDLTQFQGQLEYLAFYASIKEFSNYNFPKLKYLDISSAEGVPLFANNTFPVLEELALFEVEGFDCNHMPSLRRLTIVDSKMLAFPQKFDQTLQQLIIIDIFESTITSFDAHIMPNLKEIGIFYSKLVSFTQNSLHQAISIYLVENSLSHFDCRGLPAVQKLNLTFNQLDDRIVDTLIDCKLPDLSMLDLSNNPISDTNSAKNRLGQAYPNALILV